MIFLSVAVIHKPATTIGKQCRAYRTARTGVFTRVSKPLLKWTKTEPYTIHALFVH